MVSPSISGSSFSTAAEAMARFFTCRLRIFSSTVSRPISWYVVTIFVWPMRWAIVAVIHLLHAWSIRTMQGRRTARMVGKNSKGRVLITQARNAVLFGSEEGFWRRTT